jgi:predicted ArsR family transcriptional regulator
MDRPPLDTLSSLADPTRRRVYEFVSLQGRRVSRDEVASGAGIGRTLAAYHLDRLAAEGLLAIGYQRRSGRTGPGAGRPAKLYERAEGEVAISVPPRDYGLAARLLADAAATDASRDATTTERCACATAPSTPSPSATRRSSAT